MSSATPPRIGRALSAGSHHETNEAGSDTYDALRDLFLGHDGTAQSESHTPADAHAPVESPTPTRPADSRRPSLEALVLGHLPVQQSPWVMQYAKDAAAQRGGPVALLRIREGEATIDLVGSSTAPSCPPAASLDDAIRSVAGLISGVIVRVDPTSEPLLPSLPCVDAITLLTGADEMAIVGSYRTIKGLIGESQDRFPQLRLAIMGSTTEKAMAAAEKIQRAVESNLKEAITVSACLAKIGAGRSTLIYRGLLTDDVATVLERLRGLLDQPQSPPSRPANPAEPRVTDRPDDPPPSAQHRSAVSSRLGHASPPLAEAQSAGAAEEAIRIPPLCSHIPGLTPTPVTCPAQDSVQFALDDQGGLHLLARTSTDQWTAAGSLLVASHWAKAHASLIRLALQGSGRRFDMDRKPTLHLMVPVAGGAAALSDAGIHTHLLVQVRIEGKSGWFCTELA